MNYNVESWLSERGYETMRDAGGLSVIDGKGGTYQLDTSAFSNVDGTLRGTSASILSALSKSGASGPRGFTPLRNTLSAAGASVGYNKLADAPIVNGQMLNKNDSRLIKVGDDYWIEEGYAKSFVPKSFKDPYEKETKSLVSELTNMRFSYDPQSDASLRAAQDEAMLAAKQAANSRGLLGGSTAEIMRQRAAQELVPQYEQMAYARYNADRAGKLETLSTLGALSKNAFSEYESERDAGLSERVFADSVQNTANEGPPQTAS